MTRDLDPDRRRPAPKHPGFAQKPLDIDLDVCRRCRAVIPATDFARLKHQERDEQIDTLLAQLPTSPPTPEQEATQAGRSGAEGSKQAGADTSLVDATTPPGSPNPPGDPGGTT